MKKLAVLLLDKDKNSAAIDHTLKELKSSDTPHEVFSAQDISQVQPEAFDALIILDDLREAAPMIAGFHASSKPIGVFDQGIALVAEVLGREGVTVAVGKNMNPHAIAKTGAYAETCNADDFVTDRENKVVSTHNDPVGIRRALAELVEMA
jgi:enhancing lycopene biosynthesis protein 2